MTDKEKLAALLDGTEIIYDEVWDGKNDIIIINEGDGPKKKGYNHFYTVFLFDENEKLTEVGAYE